MGQSIGDDEEGEEPAVNPRACLVGALELGPVPDPLSGCQSLPGGHHRPIRFGVSGPFSGNSAEYGRIWQQAMNLARDEINQNGIGGRQLEIVYEDTQSDPKQSVPVAQKFVGDPTIVAELGDFASPASMAASPIYERGKLVQFGFTNSHPDFTPGGEYMFSTTLSQEQDAAYLATTAFDTNLSINETLDDLKNGIDTLRTQASKFDRPVRRLKARAPLRLK